MAVCTAPTQRGCSMNMLRGIGRSQVSAIVLLGKLGITCVRTSVFGTGCPGPSPCVRGFGC